MKNNQNTKAFILTDNYFALFVISFVVLFVGLGAKELWTHEARWALICDQMLKTKDYLHPYLHGEAYYDKPLLSYWFIIICSKLFNVLNEFVLRVPSFLSGFFTIFFTVMIGKKLFDARIGLLSGFILITTYYFVFWSRTGAADILNVLGIYVSVYWYSKNKENFNTVKNLIVFFIIMALTSLTKGLTGFIFPILIILPDIFINKTYKLYFNIKLIISVVPGIVIYLLPFILSSIFNNNGYSESGLNLVFRENIERFLNPFDHVQPFYAYFKYLPIYFFPWIILFIPLFIVYARKIQKLDNNTKWLMSAFVVVFLFLTLSGSRRSYYVLPLLPLCSLITAKLLIEYNNQKLLRYIKYIIGLFIVLFFCLYGIIQPFFTSKITKQFSYDLINAAETLRPVKDYTIIFFRPLAKVEFYLNLDNKKIWLRDPKDISKIPDLIKENKEVVIITRLEYKDKIFKMLPKNIMIAEKKLKIFDLIDSKSCVGFIIS